MINVISKVDLNSIGEEVGIEVGDKLLSINGKEVEDIIDYRFLTSDEELILEVEKQDGEVWEIEIEKDYDEELGLEFKEAILDKARSCRNKCIFCFVDQLPKGMRETLYFKDDDSRLSFLQGNFVTLTNMNDEEINRIIKYRISPINISVHTTNPELRVQMLNNKNAGKLYERMKRMAEAGIKMDCQIVLCPGINDGKELERTLDDLFKLYPNVENVAVVPLGVTKYRENLAKLKTYDKEGAGEQIDKVKIMQDKFIRETGVPFVRLSDEFYVVAERDIPPTEFYEGYKQLEDGVGMLRMFRDNIEKGLKDLKTSGKGSFTVVTGASAYKEIKRAVDMIMEKNKEINIDVVKIINNYFGKTITVTGLITGTDIVSQLKERGVNDYIIMPDNLLKRGYEPGEEDMRLLLDNYTVDDIERELQREVLITDFTGEDLIKLINNVLEEG